MPPSFECSFDADLHDEKTINLKLTTLLFSKMINTFRIVPMTTSSASSTGVDFSNAVAATFVFKALRSRKNMSPTLANINPR